MFWTKTFGNKVAEIQVQFEPVLPQFELSTHINEYLVGFAFNLLNLFSLEFDWSRRVDHAGINIDIAIFGFHIRTAFIDRRHWDYKLKKWE